MFILNPGSEDLRFPPVELASPEGLLAVGGDLRAERLIEAYRHGIFPWDNPGQPILWWSPDPPPALLPSTPPVAAGGRRRRRILWRGAGQHLRRLILVRARDRRLQGGVRAARAPASMLGL